MEANVQDMMMTFQEVYAKLERVFCTELIHGGWCIFKTEKHIILEKALLNHDSKRSFLDTEKFGGAVSEKINAQERDKVDFMRNLELRSVSELSTASASKPSKPSSQEACFNPNLLREPLAVSKGITVGGVKTGGVRCSPCGINFVSNHHLSRHVQSVHLGIKFACPFCHGTYSRRHNLKNHIAAAHKSAPAITTMKTIKVLPKAAKRKNAEIKTRPGSRDAVKDKDKTKGKTKYGRRKSTPTPSRQRVISDGKTTKDAKAAEQKVEPSGDGASATKRPRIDAETPKNGCSTESSATTNDSSVPPIPTHRYTRSLPRKLPSLKPDPAESSPISSASLRSRVSSASLRSRVSSAKGKVTGSSSSPGKDSPAVSGKSSPISNKSSPISGKSASIASGKTSPDLSNETTSRKKIEPEGGGKWWKVVEVDVHDDSITYMLNDEESENNNDIKLSNNNIGSVTDANEMKPIKGTTTKKNVVKSPKSTKALNTTREIDLSAGGKSDGKEDSPKKRIYAPSLIAKKEPAANGTDYLCPHCPHRFRSAIGLQKHLLALHAVNKRRFMCLKCLKVFDCNAKLVRHAPVHDRLKSVISSKPAPHSKPAPSAGD